jgi:hypothetical protein
MRAPLIVEVRNPEMEGVLDKIADDLITVVPQARALSPPPRGPAATVTPASHRQKASQRVTVLSSLYPALGAMFVNLMGFTGDEFYPVRVINRAILGASVKDT